MELLNYFENKQLGLRRKNHRNNFNCQEQVSVNFLLSKLRCNWEDDHLTIGLRRTEDDIGDEEYFVPAFACKFRQSPGEEHILAMSNEEGTVNILNTNLSGDATYVSSLRAHENAVFDVCWVPQEPRILTVSGDKTAVLWDVEQEKKLNVFRGHNGSIKWVDFKPLDYNVFATGARDGSIMIWDTRRNMCDNVIRNCHVLRGSRRTRKTKSPPFASEFTQSVTAVLFQDDNTLISAGSSDGIIKVWDTRKYYGTSKQNPVPKATIAHNSTYKSGYSSLVMNSNRSYLFASNCDGVIYQFDCCSYSKTPVASFTGHQNRTYFVKTALSPDNQYLLSGSSDNYAYIWKVAEPGEPDFKLSGHEAEVTAVAWSPASIPKIVTCGDDMRYKLWRICTGKPEPNPQNPQLPLGTAVAVKKSKCQIKSQLLTTPLRMLTHTLFDETFTGHGDAFETPRSSTSLFVSRTPSKRARKLQLNDDHEQENCDRTTPASPKTGGTPHKIETPRTILSPSKIRNDENIRRKLAFNVQLDACKLLTPTQRHFTSPTMNLPNSVIDKLSPNASPLVSKRVRRELDWLTQLGKKSQKVIERTKIRKGKCKQRKRTSRVDEVTKCVSVTPTITRYLNTPKT